MGWEGGAFFFILFRSPAVSSHHPCLSSRGTQVFSPFKAKSKLTDPVLQEPGAHRDDRQVGGSRDCEGSVSLADSNANSRGSTEDTQPLLQEGAELAHGCRAAELS